MGKLSFITFLLVLFVFGTSLAQVGIYDSGGPLMPEQAAYDVKHYDLNLSIHPEQQSIGGHVVVTATIVHPTNVLVLDLDTLLTIKEAVLMEETNKEWPLSIERKGGKVHLPLGSTFQPGQSLQVKVAYEGQPRVAPRAPWDGGFNWETTPSGAHWIATSCQTNGADVWWPVKDHVSDKPDSMDVRIRVPKPLVVASNGRLMATIEHDDNTQTFHWHISTPISTYNVALNIAPYEVIEGTFESVAGDEFPVAFYVLPENLDKGKVLFEEIKDHLAFFEKYCGPYPFRTDKYGVAQTPHLGMEHQTIIAYGANFSNSAMTWRDWGFDALHHHELAHEWWGNLVTNGDWRDMWLHEGFGSYMQALYMEELEGKSGYQEYMRSQRRFPNRLAVAPKAFQSAQEIYKAPIYSKGSWILHTLRGLVGDEAFFKILRQMAYPNQAMEQETEGRQVRFASTDDFQFICELISGKSLDWFFEVYLRHAPLPILHSKVSGNQLTLRWETENDLPFEMPIQVELGDEVKTYEVTRTGVTIEFEKGIKPVVDPEGWLLCVVEE